MIRQSFNEAHFESLVAGNVGKYCITNLSGWLKKVPEIYPEAWETTVFSSWKRSSRRGDRHHIRNEVRRLLTSGNNTYDQLVQEASFQLSMFLNNDTLVSSIIMRRGTIHMCDTLHSLLNVYAYRALKQYLRLPVSHINFSGDITKFQNPPRRIYNFPLSLAYVFSNFKYFNEFRKKRLKNIRLIIYQQTIYGDNKILAAYCIKRSHVPFVRVQNFLKYLRAGDEYAPPEIQQKLEQRVNEAFVIGYDPSVYEPNSRYRSIGTAIDQYIRKYPHMEAVPFKEDLRNCLVKFKAPNFYALSPEQRAIKAKELLFSRL